MKKLITILLAAVMLLTLVACNDGTDIDNTPGAEAESSDNKSSEGGFIHNTSLVGGNVGEVVLEPGDTYAIISIQGFGDITVKLFPESAPVAVTNFINLAESGYYDGKIFHRIIQNFMVQGGSPFGDGTSDPNEYTFGVERSYNARHFYGALSMANAGGQNSQQFFIVNDKEPNDPTFYDPDELREVIADGYAFLAENDDGWGNPLDEHYIEYVQGLIDGYKGNLFFRENLSEEIIERYQSGGTFFLDGGYSVFGHTVDGFDVLEAVSAVEVEFNAGGELSSPIVDVIIESVKIFIKE